jgi:hypothetical protein
MSFDRPLHVDCAPDGLDRGAEDDHQAVSEILHLFAPVGSDRFAQEAEVSSADVLCRTVSEPVG